jgi:signal transduction histidine kinase
MMPDAVLSEEFNFIFATTGDAILIANHEGTITQINPAAAAMLNLRPEAVVGKQPGECFRTNATLITLFARSADALMDVRLAKRRLAVGMGKTLDDGRRMVMLRDVTEQRELESRRAELVMTIAHDLRNPLTIINGFADLIGVAGDLNADQQLYLQYVQENTLRMFEVAEELVDLAWMEAGMPFALQRVQLTDVIDAAVESLAEMANARGIVITVTVQEPLPIVMGDERRIRLLIYHLLRNAILYSTSGNAVTVRAWGDENEAYCSVADCGIGISDDEQELIFDRMYRGQSPEVRTVPGSGIGLTIARAIVRRHGGDVWATSTPGKGSTFTFVLPAALI